MSEKFKISNLDLYYGDFHALKDINMSIHANEITAFIGPSGCGKSTFLKSLNRMNDLVEGCKITGNVLLDGEDIYKGMDVNLLRKRVGMVFQKPNPFPMSIYDNIAYGPRTHGIRSKAKLDEIVEKSLRGAAIWDEVKDRLKKSALGLSGGQQQRIAIARAIVNEPEILLLDEPLGALDLKMRKEMQLELKAMHKELGITFIYVTHDQEEALTMSDKVVVMSDGMIQQVGTPEEIYNEPKNVFVADFIGESNIFSGRMTGNKRVEFCGVEFECLDDMSVGSRVDVVVRPEDVIMTEAKDGAVVGDVTSVIFKGMNYEITVEAGANEIVIQSTRNAVVGDTIGINIEPDGIHVIPADMNRNKFDGELTKDYTVLFADGEFECDVTKLYPGSRIDENNTLVDSNGKEIETAGVKVSVNVPIKDITMSDDIEAGGTTGHIISLIYKGDHYHYVVRTKNEEDIHLHDEYLWNEDDYVSVIIPKESIELKLKQED